MKEPHTQLVDALFASKDMRTERRAPRLDRRTDNENRQRRREEIERWAQRSAARNGFGG